MSIGYMIFRALGGEAEGTTLDLSGAILAYFIVHGIIAATVIVLELMVIGLGVALWKEKDIGKWHRTVSKVLFISFSLLI